MAEGGIAGGLNHAIKQIILVMAEGGIAGGLNHANKRTIRARGVSQGERIPL